MSAAAAAPPHASAGWLFAPPPPCGSLLYTTTRVALTSSLSLFHGICIVHRICSTLRPRIRTGSTYDTSTNEPTLIYLLSSGSHPSTLLACHLIYHRISSFAKLHGFNIPPRGETHLIDWFICCQVAHLFHYHSYYHPTSYLT